MKRSNFLYPPDNVEMSKHASCVLVPTCNLSFLYWSPQSHSLPFLVEFIIKQYYSVMNSLQSIHIDRHVDEKSCQVIVGHWIINEKKA